MMDVYVVERSDGLPGGHETLVAIYATEADAQKYVEELGPLADCDITRWPVLESTEAA